jgi:hypothetical protein
MHYPHTLIAAATPVSVGYSGLRRTVGWGPVTQRLPTSSSTNALDAQFIDMLASFRVCGGLARAEEALAWLDGEVEQGLSTLARWIAVRQVVSFEWQAHTWLPLFQFDRRDMSIQPQLAPILAELCGVFDAWELANWFARPNSTLDGLTPAEAFGDDHTLVLQAARTDRFAIEG